MPGYDPALYAGPSLPMFDPDSAQKVEDLVDALEKADWVAVTSGRVYMNVTRVPSVFPMSIAYYRALFDGRLGFERAADFSSYPVARAAAVPRRPRRRAVHGVRPPSRPALPEDTRPSRPRRSAGCSSPRSRRRRPRCTTGSAGRGRSGASRAPVLPDRRPEVETATSVEPGEVELPRRRSWRGTSRSSLVGLLAMPLAWAAFPRFADRGFGFARILGLVIVDVPADG